MLESNLFSIKGYPQKSIANIKLMSNVEKNLPKFWNKK